MKNNLPQFLIEIANRFGRNTDPGIDSLRMQLSAWSSAPENTEYQQRWNELVVAILTQPHWMGSLFPKECEDFPELITLLKKLTQQRAHDDARATASAESLHTWIKEQSDLENPEGLVCSLLSYLHDADPASGAHFYFLSRYYAWLDLLVSYFVSPDLKPLHEAIFSVLHLQRLHWKNTYCFGYLYQGWEEIGLSGIKPSNARLQKYKIDDLLSPSFRVLDLGANSCFLSLAMARKVKEIDALELNPFLLEIGRLAANHTGITNISPILGDIETWTPSRKYDLVISLANHCTIDGNMGMDFENYIAKLFNATKPEGWLLFESHNVFASGTGAPGDDGDLDLKFDIVERYFEFFEAVMLDPFTPVHDVPKVFVKLRRRAKYTVGARRKFSLADIKERYLAEKRQESTTSGRTGTAAQQAAAAEGR